jgi:hypothetical protein
MAAKDTAASAISAGRAERVDPDMQPFPSFAGAMAACASCRAVLLFFVTMAGLDLGCQPPDGAQAAKFERSFNM